MNENKILVCKNSNQIIISKNGKRLIINKDDNLFDELNNKTKEEIKEWFINR